MQHFFVEVYIGSILGVLASLITALSSLVEMFFDVSKKAEMVKR